MALTPLIRPSASTLRASCLGLAVVLACTATCRAQQPASSGQAAADQAEPSVAQHFAAPPAGGFKPDANSDGSPDVWIFSGELQSSHETFSGTLVAGKDDTQFELKLAGGASCDGSDLKGEVGLVRLKEITCSDGRPMRALFVPQGGTELKVYGHVGDERFSTAAHLLGTDAVPEKQQTAEPKGPLGLPRMPSTDMPPSATPPKP